MIYEHWKWYLCVFLLVFGLSATFRSSAKNAAFIFCSAKSGHTINGMPYVLCVSLHVLDDVDCNMPYVCKNLSAYPLGCDDMLHDSLGVVKIPNVKLLKKKSKKFHEVLSKFVGENDDLIAKLNESNKLVEKYKKLAKNSFEKMKEFECLNVNLDAKPVLSNKLDDF